MNAETARASVRPGDVVVRVDGHTYRAVDVDGRTSSFVAYGPLQEERPDRDLEYLGFASLQDYHARETVDVDDVVATDEEEDG